MKQATYSVALTLSLMLVLGGMFPVHGGMMGPGHGGHPGQGMEPPAGGPKGAMGPHMKHGMMGEGMRRMQSQMMPGMERGGMLEGMRMHRPSHMIRMLRTELDLSDEQAQKAKAVLFQVMKANIKQRAELRIAELELQELLEADPVEMGHVEAKLKDIEGVHTTLRLNMIAAHEQVKDLLAPEQRQKLEHLHDRMHGMMEPGMMGMMELLEEGDAGGMGMMGQRGMGGKGMMEPQMMP